MNFHVTISLESTLESRQSEIYKCYPSRPAIQYKAKLVLAAAIRIKLQYYAHVHVHVHNLDCYHRVENFVGKVHAKVLNVQNFHFHTIIEHSYKTNIILHHMKQSHSQIITCKISTSYIPL